eukprot:m.22375 g.22375  ORF g.22375 m.22375 type:complete len:476 (+) comp28339_c0_seq1:72-1499(+)
MLTITLRQVTRNFSAYRRMTLNSPEALVKAMAAYGPVYPVQGDKIRVLRDPQDFFEELKSSVKTAQHRVIVASLYIGTGHKERELVDCIARRMEASPPKLRILLDCIRGSRGEESSRSILTPLLRQHPDHVSVSLYHTPNMLRALKGLLPNKFKEILGLQHMKIHIFDDKLILTGANLSHDYFTNRQDRYIVVSDSPKLADFCEKIVHAVALHSYQLQSDNTLQLNINNIDPLGLCSKRRFWQSMKSSISDLIQPEKVPSDVLETADTWICPLVQMGLFDIRNDQTATCTLLKTVDSKASVSLATGYLNLTDEYIDLLMKSGAEYRVLTASPEANGFLGASGPAGHVPYAYIYIARWFYEQIKHNKRLAKVKLEEFTKDRWTFHSKGLWYYLPGSAVPDMTLIGSSNFGHRSVTRDLEMQFGIVTKNEKLQQDLEEEHEHLFSYAKQVTDETFRREDRRVHWLQAVITRAIWSFM